jgi:hypothetical protein
MSNNTSESYQNKIIGNSDWLNTGTLITIDYKTTKAKGNKKNIKIAQRLKNTKQCQEKMFYFSTDLGFTESF